MRIRNIVCGIVAASLGFSSLTFAQPSRHEDHRDGRGARHETRDTQHDRRDMRHDQRDARHERERDAREDRRDAREDRREARYYYNARGPEFHRGGRLPPGLRDRHYVVSDWRGHHLTAPPRGYQWVQVGPDYVLAAVATGIILNLIVSR